MPEQPSSEATPPGTFLRPSDIPSPSKAETADGPPPARRDGRAEELHFPGYVLLDKLGQGGMGVVFRARQLAAGRAVALKVIRPDRRDDADADAVARFRAEARRVAALRHPNVVPIHEVGEAGGLPFFTMDYCPGGSLDQKLKGTPLPPADAARLVETLARAVQAAHAAGIVHRDLKPGNVLLAADGAPQVTDFGLAKQLDDQAGPTLSHAVLGTPSYMAPEQTLGKAGAAGTLADVYALGAILYECLTGRPPFLGPTHLDTLLLVREAEPAPPSQLQPKTPRDLETICLKCLRKESARRYASAAALAEDLRRFLAGEPILARPVGPAERLAKWARRRPAVAALLAGLAATLVAGTAVSVYFAVQAGRRAADAAEKAALARDKAKVARARKVEAQARTAEAEQAEADAEEATARSILRPLGSTSETLLGDPPSDTEWDALWELAESPGDGVRLRVLDQGLAGPAAARRLVSRRDVEIQAVVGLDPDRRRRVEQKLLAMLRDDRTDLEVKAACVLLGVSLGGYTRPFGTSGFIQDLENAGAGASCSGVSPEFAREACLAAAGLLGNPKGPSNIMTGQLGPAVHALSSRLDHDGATAAAQALTDAMSKTDATGSLYNLAQGLAGVLERLPPDERVEPGRLACRTFADAMPRVARRGPAANGSDSNKRTPAEEATAQLFSLGRGMGLVLTRLRPGEAADSARDAANALTDFLPTALAEKPTSNAVNYWSFGLEGVAEGVDSAAAARLVPVLIDAIGRTTDQNGADPLGRALTAVAARLDRAAPADAAGALVAALRQGANPYHEAALANGLGAVLRRLPADDAAPHARVAADALIAFLARYKPSLNDNNYSARPLADGFSAVAEGLGARDAAVIAHSLADASNVPAGPARAARVAWLAAVYRRLSPDDAAAVAAKLPAAMGNGLDFYTLADAWRQVQDGRPPAAVVGAARALAEAMSQAKDASALENLAIQTPTIAGWLDHDAAAAVADEIADRLANAPQPYAAAGLAIELGEVLGRLPPAEAATRARAAVPRLADAFAKAGDASLMEPLARGLGALLRPLPRDEAAPRAREAALLLAGRLQAGNQGELTPLTRAVGYVAPALDRDGAAAAARAMITALARTNDTGVAWSLKNGLHVLAANLDRDAAPGLAAVLDDAAAGPHQAALLAALSAVVTRLAPDQIPASAPRRLSHALAATPDRNDGYTLERGFEASAGRLDHDGAVAAARELGDALAKQDKNDQELLLQRARALGAALDRLPPDEAARLIREPAEALMAVRPGPSVGISAPQNAARALLAMTARTNGLDNDSWRGTPARQLVAAMGLAPNPFAALPVLALEAQPVQSRLPAQILVDLLKEPGCVDLARDVVLRQLAGQCGRPFRDVWDFADWAAENRPDLDLKSPPRREGP